MHFASSHLYTFGYEGLNIESFVARVRAERIRIVVDVRELPLSRKKGFSKTGFKTALANAGIDYLHLPALGCPRDIRNRYKLDRDWSAYTKDFTAYVQTQEPTIREIVRLACGMRICLVCFEADFTMCHRTYVARAARRLGGPEVRHLTVKTVLPDCPLQLAA